VKNKMIMAVLLLGILFPGISNAALNSIQGYWMSKNHLENKVLHIQGDQWVIYNYDRGGQQKNKTMFNFKETGLGADFNMGLPVLNRRGGIVLGSIQDVFYQTNSIFYIPSGFDERVELTEHSNEKKNDVYYIKMPEKDKLWVWEIYRESIAKIYLVSQPSETYWRLTESDALVEALNGNLPGVFRNQGSYWGTK